MLKKNGSIRFNTYIILIIPDLSRKKYFFLFFLNGGNYSIYYFNFQVILTLFQAFIS